MRKLLVSLTVLALLLVAADRVGATLASRAVADQIAASGELSGAPQVSIGGFPFLTQALSGRYDEITVSASGLTGDRGVSGFDARLSGVRLPLSAALSGSVREVPVERVSARVLLSYPELERRLASRRLKLSPAGPLLRVTGSVTVLGRTVSASALSSLTVSGGDVLVTAVRFEVGARPADAALTAALGRRLDFRAEIGALPYGLTLTAVAVRPGGVEATATARSTVLTR